MLLLPLGAYFANKPRECSRLLSENQTSPNEFCDAVRDDMLTHRLDCGRHVAALTWIACTVYGILKVKRCSQATSVAFWTGYSPLVSWELRNGKENGNYYNRLYRDYRTDPFLRSHLIKGQDSSWPCMLRLLATSQRSCAYIPGAAPSARSLCRALGVLGFCVWGLVARIVEF